MEENKTPEQLKRENNFNFAKSISEGIGSIDKARANDRRRKVNTDNILTALENPYTESNVNNLQQQSEIMRVVNNILKEIQFYKANILTYDHWLVPIDSSKYKGKSDKFFKDLRKAAIELEKYNIKTLCPWLIEQMIRLGEIYIYKQQGDDDTTFFKMPNNMCKITHCKSFINGYSIKLSLITDKTLNYYPTDIQKLYKKYKNGQLKNDKNFVDNYYKLEIDKAVAFTPEILESKGIPYYSGLLLDLSRIKDLNDLSMSNAETDNFKLVHQLLPSNDNGEVSIDFETASMYHSAMKNQLPEGIGGISTPYPINSVTLTNNSNKNYDYLNTLRTNIYNGSGVDSSLFNSDNRNTTQATIYAAIVDGILAKNLLDRIKIWLNYDFGKNSVLKNFRISFTDSTIYDKEAKVSAACGRLATWSGKLEYMALQGYSPLDAINVLQLEDNIDFESMLKPLMNSHTMSGSDVDNGRPTAGEESGDINKAPENPE